MAEDLIRAARGGVMNENVVIGLTETIFNLVCDMGIENLDEVERETLEQAVMSLRHEVVGV